MPQAPNVDGLPLWLQITVSVIFCVVTLVVAIKGYQSAPKATRAEAATAAAHNAVAAAHVADMAALHALSEANHQLRGEVIALTRATTEMTHFLRDSIELKRELCQRLRELRELIERQ